MLYRSLTNIIVQSLKEGEGAQEGFAIAPGAGSGMGTGVSAEADHGATPLEKLFMQPFDPASLTKSQDKNGQAQFNFSSSDSIPQSFMPSHVEHYSQPQEINAGGIKQRNTSTGSSGSPYSSTGGPSPGSAVSSEMSPIEALLMSPATVSVPENSPMSVNSVNSAYSDKSQLQSEPSPIESLLMSPSLITTADKMKSYNQHVNMNVNMNDNINLRHSLSSEEQMVPNNGMSNGTYLSMMESNSPSIHDSQNMNDLDPKGDSMTNDAEQSKDLALLDLDLDAETLKELADLTYTAEELDEELHMFESYQDEGDMTVPEMDELISKLTAVAISHMTRFEMLTCEEIKRRHKVYLVSEPH